MVLRVLLPVTILGLGDSLRGTPIRPSDFASLDWSKLAALTE